MSILNKIKENRLPPPPEHPGHDSLHTSSEFKKYFGFEQHLHSQKVTNDKELSFKTKKMDKVSMIFASAILGIFLYFGAVSNLWESDKRKDKCKYWGWSRYAYFKLKVMKVGGVQ